MKKIQIGAPIEIVTGEPIDSRHKAWNSKKQALANIQKPKRYIGLEVSVKKADGKRVKMWWKDGIENDDLVEFGSSVGGNSGDSFIKEDYLIDIFKGGVIEDLQFVTATKSVDLLLKDGSRFRAMLPNSVVPDLSAPGAGMVLGSWIPSSQLPMTNVVARFTKVGNLVHAYFQMTLGILADYGVISPPFKITGLPYTPANELGIIALGQATVGGDPFMGRVTAAGELNFYAYGGMHRIVDMTGGFLSGVAIYEAAGDVLDTGLVGPGDNPYATKVYVDEKTYEKVDKNTLVVAKTGMRISYDAKGLVIGSADAGISHINGLPEALEAKVNKVIFPAPPLGIAWTLQTVPEANDWAGLHFANNKFVAVAAEGTTSRVMWSSDGKQWNAVVCPPGTWSGVTYGNGLWVAVCHNDLQNGQNFIMTSPDAITWTPRSAPNGYEWSSIAFGAGRFVAVSQYIWNPVKIMTSTDGVTWTVNNFDAGAQRVWRWLQFVNGLFIAKSNFDYGGGGNAIMTSPDGINWTLTNIVNTGLPFSITYGNGTWVAASSYNSLISSDGINWVQGGSFNPFSNSYNMIAYGNGVFIALSFNTLNRSVRSIDGINWTEYLTPASVGRSGLVFGNGTFVSISYDGDTSNSVMIADGSLSVLPPASPTDTGVKTEVRIVGDYKYECIATNIWIRTLIDVDFIEEEDLSAYLSHERINYTGVLPELLFTVNSRAKLFKNPRVAVYKIVDNPDGITQSETIVPGITPIINRVKTTNLINSITFDALIDSDGYIILY